MCESPLLDLRVHKTVYLLFFGFGEKFRNSSNVKDADSIFLVASAAYSIVSYTRGVQ